MVAGGNNTKQPTSDEEQIVSSLQIEQTPIILSNKISEEKINTTRFTISGRILDIIEKLGEGEIEETEAIKIGEYMRKYILLNLKNIEQGNSTSIFKKYFNGDNSINTDIFNGKFNKYFPMHFPILIEKIKKKINISKIIEKRKDAEDGIDIPIGELCSKKENSILNLLKKYSYIIFIFGEKIKLGELNKLLNLNIKAISSLRQSVSQNMKILELHEQKQIESLYSESKIINNLEKNGANANFDPLFTDHICAITYRNIFRKVMSEGEDVTIMKSLDSVGNEVEKLYKIEFKGLYTIFKKWYDSDGTVGDNLFHLEDIIRKILGSITIFKNSNIAFTETFSSSFKQGNFLQEVNTNLIEGNITVGKDESENKQKSEEKIIELFKNFLEIVVNGGKNDKYQEFIKNINKLKKKTAESKIPEALNYNEHLDLDEVDFDGWDNIHENQKYELMFSEIIGKDGKLIISKYLQLEKLDENLISLFTKSYGIDYNIVLAQFQEIKGLSKANTSIKDFIKNDVNNLNLIIIWWRFLLKIRKLEKNKNIGEILVEDIKNIKEKPYGVIEIISEKLKEKGVLESNKLEFKPEGRLNNISVQTLQEQLKSILKGFKKGHIDLSKTTVNIGGNDILVKDLTDLYIPFDLSDNNKSSNTTNEDFPKLYIEMNRINDWLNTGIDLCFNLLHDKKISDTDQKKYLELLKNNNILQEDIGKLDIKDKDNIKSLAEALKYIKHKRKKLREMMEIGNDDKFKLIELLGPHLKNNKEEMITDFFGPDKSYTRAFNKLIKLYSGDLTLIGDLTRLRIVENSIDEMIKSIVEFINFSVDSDEITHVSIIDLIGQPISDSIKSSGYRDIKLLLSLKGGNVVEQQFQYKEMLDAKEIGIDLTNRENLPIFEKLKKEGKLFTLDEVKKFIQFAHKKNIELPTVDILNNLLRDGNVYGLINELGIEESLLTNKYISTTYTYNIIRQLPDGSELGKKFTKLERVISDSAWSGAVLKYLENKKIKID